MLARANSRHDYSSLTPSLPQTHCLFKSTPSSPLHPPATPSPTPPTLSTTTTAPPPVTTTISARHICTRVREWLWHSKCHNPGHRLVAIAMSRCTMLTISKLKRWSINYYIDTAQTAERRCAGSGPGGRRTGGVLLRARNPHPGLAVGRRHPHRRHAGRPDRCPARGRGRRRGGGGALARRRESLPTVRTGAHSVSAVCTGSI